MDRCGLNTSLIAVSIHLDESFGPITIKSVREVKACPIEKELCRGPLTTLHVNSSNVQKFSKYRPYCNSSIKGFSVNSTIWGALVTASILGVTHAIEPDHVAGITSLTGSKGGTKVSAIIGACFSIGHVVLVVIWIGIGYVVLGRTSFPTIYGRIGTLGVGFGLGLLGCAMVIGGLRSVFHTHEHKHAETTHAHLHLHLPRLNSLLSAIKSKNEGEGCGDVNHFQVDSHSHNTLRYLKMGIVGALFTLSPPLSMIVFVSTLFPQYGVSVVGPAVVTYAFAITLTMSLLGAGVGTVIETLTWNQQIYGSVRIAGGALIFAFSLLILAEATILPV